MILFDGKMMPDEALDEVLDGLQEHCIRTIEGHRITAAEVIEACGILAERIENGFYDHVLEPLLRKGVFTEAQLQEAILFFDRENLQYRYETELGVRMEKMEDLIPPHLEKKTEGRHRICVPLGILFHMAAGNAEGLPFYSVIEGLLTGNVNILKLPSADDGLSVLLLRELITVCPKLAAYITVFDLSSARIEILQKLGKLADAIVVWGGDDAIRAARAMADPETQIISWGHKLSFAYVTPEVSDGELCRLAAHICATNQTLCSSCQGLFVDTEDRMVQEQMGMRFLALLEEENARSSSLHMGIRGKISISLYNEELESIHSHRKILRGRGVSVILSEDHELELSHMFRNCWVKRLPRQKIISALKPYRGHLQTAGLLCPESDRAHLEEQLCKAGVVRITRAAHMSRMLPAEAHDGESVLRRYSRIVEMDM